MENGIFQNESEKKFFCDLQKKILCSCMKHWSRRGCHLLEVNSAAGELFPLFRECGFDVTGSEHDAKLRHKAESMASGGFEVIPAADDHLPFDDDSFDWVILHLRNGNTAFMQSVEESFRVTKRGLLITFWNKLSFPVLWERMTRRSRFNYQDFHNCLQVWRGAQQICNARAICRSILCGPRMTWASDFLFARCNAWLSHLPFGAWCVLRMDFQEPRTVIPLSLRLNRQSIVEAEPAMQRRLQ